MLNNVSYEQIARMVNSITIQTINQTNEYLMQNYSEKINEGFVLMSTVGENITKFGESVGENASEYVLDKFNEVRSDAIEFLFENIDFQFNWKEKAAMFLRYIASLMFHIANKLGDLVFIYRDNTNIHILISVYVVVAIIMYQINKLRHEFNSSIEDMCMFIDQNELEHMNMIDESRTEFKKLISAQNRRITNGLKKLQTEQLKYSKRQDMMMYERIRNHRHEELRDRICLYLDLFNQYANGDKYNVLFNLSNEISYLNPKAEGAVVKKYFGKYLVWNNAAKSQILYPLNIAYSPAVYTESSRNICNYADSVPTSNTNELSKFREVIENNYSELFNFPVVRAPKETQVDFEISVFEYIDECLCGCYKTYNIYCNAGLN